MRKIALMAILSILAVRTWTYAEEGGAFKVAVEKR